MEIILTWYSKVGPYSIAYNEQCAKVYLMGMLVTTVEKNGIFDPLPRAVELMLQHYHTINSISAQT